MVKTYESVKIKNCTSMPITVIKPLKFEVFYSTGNHFVKFRVMNIWNPNVNGACSIVQLNCLFCFFFQFYFFVAQAFCLVSALLFRRYLPASEFNTKLRHIVELSLGVAVGIFCFGR